MGCLPILFDVDGMRNEAGLDPATVMIRPIAIGFTAEIRESESDSDKATVKRQSPWKVGIQSAARWIKRDN